MKTSTAIGVILTLIIGFWLGASRGASEFNFDMGTQKVVGLFDGFGSTLLTLVIFGVIVVTIRFGLVALRKDGWKMKDTIFAIVTAVFVTYMAIDLGLLSTGWKSLDWNAVVRAVAFCILVAALTAVTVKIHDFVGDRRQSTASESGAKSKGGGRK